MKEQSESGGQGELGLNQPADEKLAYYYSTPGRYGLLQQVIHFVRFGEGVPVIQGAVGSGKTTLSEQLLAQLQPESSVVLVDAGKGISGLFPLLAEISEGFGLPAAGENAGEQLAGLRHYARALVESGKLGVLIVDDADELDDQALGGLMSLMQGGRAGEGGLHLVFFSKSGLAERIDELGLLDVPVYDFDVPAFSPSEMAGFLGGVQGELLPNERVQSIWGGSQGYPGAALKLLSASDCGADVDEADGEREPNLLSSLPLAHVAALGLLLVALIWAFFSSEEGDSLGVPAVVRQGEQTQEKASKVEPSIEIDNEIEGGVSEEVHAEVVENVREVSDSKPEKAELVIDAFSKAADAAQGQQKDAPKLESALLNSEREGLTDVASAGSDAEASGPAKGAVGSAEDAVGRRPTAEALPAQEVGPSVQPNLDEDFLLAQKGGAYTLQVLAASQKEALIQFVNRQPNRSNLKIYQGLREGRRLYVVVAGVFPTRKAALDAIIDLPLTQRQAGPWPRQLESIQRDIAENRRK